ncbi:hypothetical protein LXEBMM8_EKPBGFGD_00960 [Lactiplantibacillus xiangfangensis]
MLSVSGGINVKRWLTDYLLGLPGYILSLYLVSPLHATTWWGLILYLSVSYWVAYPILLRMQPALGLIRSMSTYEPPYVKQLTDPDKRAPREPVTPPSSLGEVSHEVDGFGWLSVGLKRWGLSILALPWIGVLALMRAKK